MLNVNVNSPSVLIKLDTLMLDEGFKFHSVLDKENPVLRQWKDFSGNVAFVTDVSVSKVTQSVTVEVTLPLSVGEGRQRTQRTFTINEG